MSRGTCVVCGVENESGRDFICDECGDPNGVILFCERCKTHTALDAEALAIVERRMGVVIPQRHGVVLKNSRCEDCSPGTTDVRTVVYLLKTN